MGVAGVKKRQNKKRSKKKFPINNLIMIFAFIVFILTGIFLLIRPNSNKPTVDYIDLIRSQGYTPNIGMSSFFKPGAIIRTKEASPDGAERSIVDPLIFFWGDKCFPNQLYREVPYLLPNAEGVQSASLSLGMESVKVLLPAIKLNSAAVADYHIRFENCRLLSFAEAEIDRHFSGSCVESIKNALRDGKKLEWFSVIFKVISAESFTFEISWRSNASVESRLEAINLVEQDLQNAIGSKTSEFINMQAGTNSEASQKTVISGKGELIIGYHARPLQPIYEGK